MKQFIAFVKKEFYHVLRDKRTLFILFGMPVAQILIFGFALTNEIKDAKILIVDNAKDISSQQIISKIASSNYFEIENAVSNNNQIDPAFRKGIIQLALVFPANFNDDLMHLHKARIQIIADASDPNMATTLTNYISTIIQDYQLGLNKTFS